MQLGSRNTSKIVCTTARRSPRRGAHQADVLVLSDFLDTVFFQPTPPLPSREPVVEIDGAIAVDMTPEEAEEGVRAAAQIKRPAKRQKVVNLMDEHEEDAAEGGHDDYYDYSLPDPAAQGEPQGSEAVVGNDGDSSSSSQMFKSETRLPVNARQQRSTPERKRCSWSPRSRRSSPTSRRSSRRSLPVVRRPVARVRLKRPNFQRTLRRIPLVRRRLLFSRFAIGLRLKL